MNFKAAIAVAASLAILCAQSAHAAPPKLPKEPSLYVQCDGSPAGESGAVTAARVLAITAVVGLLLPQPEAADAGKRKQGTAGVAVCNQVLQGRDAAQNPLRRQSLILARAIHRIEAQDYAAALDDVGLARSEAQAAGLAANPYFARSMALSYDQLEAAALLRMRKFAEAQAAATRHVELARYSLYGLLNLTDYAGLTREADPGTLAYADAMSRALPTVFGMRRLFILEDWGKFVEAAQLADDMNRLNQSFVADSAAPSDITKVPRYYAEAALAYALAGDFPRAQDRAMQARAIDRQRVAEGKPEAGRSGTIEVLDLYDVLKSVHDGKLAEARRSFAARSSWVGPSLGAVLAANDRLRKGAKSDELFGALAKTSDQLWEEAREARLAVFMAKDDDNKTLYELLVPYVRANALEGRSRDVWRTENSKILLTPKDPKATVRIAFLYATPSDSRYDAFMLHTALIAQKEGKADFIFLPYKNDNGSVLVRTGNRGDPDIPASFAVDAAGAIASLSPIIPDPVALAARRSAAKVRAR